MGSCVITAKPSNLKVHKKVIPNFLYLLRSNRVLLTTRNGKTVAVALDKSIDLNEKSIVSQVTPTHLVFCPVFCSDNSPSLKIYVINSVTLTIHTMPDLPTHVTQGFIFSYNSHILVLSSSPLFLLSYSIDSHEWSTVQLNFKHKNYKKLHGFSAYLQRNCIFLICCKKRNEFLESIFSINLDTLAVEKTEERFEQRISGASCLASGNSVILAGGTKENGEFNKVFWEKKESLWEEIKGPEIEKYEDYPILKCNQNYIFCSYGKVVVMHQSKFFVHNLHIPLTLKNAQHLRETNNSEFSVKNEEKPKNSNEINSLNRKEKEDLNENSHTYKGNHKLEISSPEEIGYQGTKISNQEYQQPSPMQKHEDRSSKSSSIAIIKKIKHPAPFLPSNVIRRNSSISESIEDQ